MIQAGVLAPTRPAPPGYPSSAPGDPHVSRPQPGDFAARREAYLRHVRSTPAPTSLAGIFHEVARIRAGGEPHLGIVEAALDYVESRTDCADFVLHAILRLLYQFGAHPAFPEDLRERARAVALGFKYWPDEPGRDSLCSWTENHQLLFASAALLAGQLYPEEKFENSGQSGREKQRSARQRLWRWLDLRFRTGFSEWLSNVYYDEDATGLLSLVDFAEDDQLRLRAAMVLDWLFLDLAQHSFRGLFACSHGRSYERSLKWAAQESTTDLAKLAFGLGRLASRECLSVACLALSDRYRVPEAIEQVARDVDRERVEIRQRMGIRVEECERWGIGLDDPEDGMLLLQMEAYTHPRSIELFVEMLGAYDWWDNDFFAPFRARRRGLEWLARARALPALASWLEGDLTRNLRPEVNVLTVRTPDYQLSSAQDWRAGYGGDQQHPWQATLGPDAVCFTTHPGPRQRRSPGHWTGSACLPRVAQVGNVVLAVYQIDTLPALFLPNHNLYTHAWLPRDRFDEVVESGHWVFARLGDGYLALYSRQPTRWQQRPGEDQGRELIAEGRANAWICELGRRADDGDFEGFCERIRSATLQHEDGQLAYHSPSQGLLEFGWLGPLRRDREVVALGPYGRSEGPYARAAFPADTLEVRCRGRKLHLDWQRGLREESIEGQDA